MYDVIKRDGSTVEFNLSKIENAIKKAFDAVGKEYIDTVIETIALRVTADFSGKVKDGHIHVEDIQDSVERVLGETGYGDVAKAYILYRENHAKIRDVKGTVLDYKKLVDDYIGNNDWRVKENSTVNYSIGGLILSNSGAVTANYWLTQIYDKEIGEAHRNGDIHIHDLSMLSAYCAGHNLKQLIKEGLGGITGKITSAPAKHLSTLANQMVNYIGCLQNEFSGAQAFSSFDTYLAPFVKADNLSYKEVKQAIQSFVYGLNTPSRWGCIPETYKVMTTEGWKGIDELKDGDILYTWKDGKLSKARNNKVIIKEHHGKLLSFRNPHYGYEQTVTGYHRTLVSKSNCKVEDAIIMQADDIRNSRCANWKLPTAFPFGGIDDKGIDLSDDEIRLAAMIYTDGSIDTRKGKLHKISYTKSLKRYPKTGTCDVFESLGLNNVPDIKTSGLSGKAVLTWSFYGVQARYIYNLIGGSKKRIDDKFLLMNEHQARIFLETWIAHDGSKEKMKAQCDNRTIMEQIAFINVLAGHCSSVQEKPLKSGKHVNYVKTNQVGGVTFEIVEENYDGRVWCPNDEDGTAIFMNDKGGVFISGQCQSPFSNITLDWVCPNDQKNLPAIVGGEEMNFNYGDCQKEMDMINKAFIEIMIEGDADGRGFQYPIPTYSITKDFDWNPEKENNRLLFEMTAKYGTPYFTNFINSDMNPSDIRSMCCRLLLDIRELRKKGGGYFGSGESTGSIGVVTIDLPRIAYLSKDKEEFYERLDRIMDISARSLKIKRDVVTKLMDAGLYPYTKRYLGSFNTYFSTIGLVGMNEACLNAKWLRCNLGDKKAQDFAIEVLNHMRTRLSDYQEKYGDLYNLEATPAESCSYRLAKHDKEKHTDIITASSNEDAPYYTNSTHLPVGYTDDIFQALDIEDPMQVLYTSGTVFHAFLGEKMPNWESAMNLVRTIAENYRLPYFTLSPTYSVCPDHGYISGEVYKCPVCGKPTEVYSRITGYYRPVQNWNVGKAEEFRERKTYDVPKSKLTHSGPLDGVQAAETPVMTAKKADELLLFTTKTCPNCRIAKAALDKAGKAYTVIDAEENADLCRQYGVMQAPTLVVLHDGSATVITNASNIRAYAEQH